MLLRLLGCVRHCGLRSNIYKMTVQRSIRVLPSFPQIFRFYSKQTPTQETLPQESLDTSKKEDPSSPISSTPELENFEKRKDQIQNDNFLIKLYATSGQDKKVIELFDQMEQKGVKLTYTSLNWVIRSFSKLNDTEKALELYNRLKKFQAVPEERTYNQLIQMFGKLQDTKNVNFFFQEMVSIYSPKAIRLFNNNNKERRKFREPKFSEEKNQEKNEEPKNKETKIKFENNLIPKVVYYNALIKSAIDRKTHEKAIFFFHEMKLKNIEPDEITFNLLIKMYGELGMKEKSAEMLKQLLELTNKK